MHTHSECVCWSSSYAQNEILYLQYDGSRTSYSKREKREEVSSNIYWTSYGTISHSIRSSYVDTFGFCVFVDVTCAQNADIHVHRVFVSHVNCDHDRRDSNEFKTCCMWWHSVVVHTSPLEYYIQRQWQRHRRWRRRPPHRVFAWTGMSHVCCELRLDSISIYQRHFTIHTISQGTAIAKTPCRILFHIHFSVYRIRCCSGYWITKIFSKLKWFLAFFQWRVSSFH